jgi:hypothetical protein
VPVKRSGLLALVFIMTLTLFFPFPRGALGAPEWSDPAYQTALEDAKIRTAAEVSRDLTAITASEPGLIWEGMPGNSRVLVVSWVGPSEFNVSPGTEITLAREANLWVTVVPQMKEYFARHGIPIPGDPSLRIEQLLGMPPQSGCIKFVEAWVQPRDLFRPSPDPEVNDHEATLDFPTDSSSVLTFSPTFTLVEVIQGKPVEMGYRDWFTNRLATIYTCNEPYPWTGLGYTYNWGKGGDHIGLSEFVVRAGANIGIQAVVPTASYFVTPTLLPAGTTAAQIPILIWVVIGILILTVLLLSFLLYLVLRRKIRAGH